MEKAFELIINSGFVYFLYGLLFGSFLNVVIYRVPRGLSISYPPSACPKCKKNINWYDNIPILSWLILRGKCRNCKNPISIQYPLIELLTGLVTLAIFYLNGVDYNLIFLIPISYLLIVIGITDIKTFTIPFTFQISLLVLLISFSIFRIWHDNLLWYQPLLGALAGFLGLSLIGLIGRIIYKQTAMAGGDIILFTILGLLLGPLNTLYAFFFSALSSVIFYIIPFISSIPTKKKEINNFLKQTKLIEKNLPPETKIPNKLKILKLLVAFNQKNKNFTELRDSFLKEENLNNLSFKNKIRLFFTFVASLEKEPANKVLKIIDQEIAENKLEELRTVLDEDLIGYNNFDDNLKLLRTNLKNLKLEKSLVILKQANLKSKYDLKIINLKTFSEKFAEIENETKKIEFLLFWNRIFQYSGYFREQLHVKKILDSYSAENIQNAKFRIISDSAFVYYSDFFKNEFSEEKEKIIKVYNLETLFLFYKLVVYRIIFYKEKMPFGPHLALGAMISYFFGSDLINLYLEILEKTLR